jgi:hypothetical protein
MSFVLLMFKQTQPGMYESLTYNDAHVAIAQYKANCPMWFERVPCVGELVSFAAPQGGGSVYFVVEEVRHRPLEVSSMSVPSPTAQSAIFLCPILMNQPVNR